VALLDDAVDVDVDADDADEAADDESAL